MAVCLKKFFLLALAAWVLLGAGCGAGENQPLSAEVDDPTYRQGQQFVKQGRTQEALTSFLKVIEKRGAQSSAESHLEAGLIYLNHSKDPVEAYHHFRQYLAQQPNSPESKHVRELVDTAKRDFARSLPGQPLENQAVRSQMNEHVDRLTRENEELRAEIAALRSGAAAQSRTTRAPTNGEPPRLTVPVAAAPVIPVEEPSPITVAPVRPGPATATPPAQNSPTSAGQNTRALPSRPDGVAPNARRHTVVPGDTLYNLTRKYYGTVSAAKADALYEANRDVMKNPGDLRPGMEIKIP